MPPSPPKRLAILGAGPIGLEAAAFAARRGMDVRVYERGAIGHHVRNWSHITLFSPWSLNRSAWGEEMVREQGIRLEDGETFPTGSDYLTGYLCPLARHPQLRGRVHAGHEVLGVSRRHALKGEFIARPERDGAPFLIHLRRLLDGEERYEEADAVVDATGSYRHANALGFGGLRALGETGAEAIIERYVPDVLGEERARYEGARVLVVGAGFSAVTSARALAELNAGLSETLWLMRSAHAPYEVIHGDVLPQRGELAAFGNAASAGEVEGISPLLGSCVARIAPGEDGWDVHIQRGEKTHVVTVDRVVANVGYRPDMAITRELQVHHCWATEGPMKLAASLLSAGAGGGDCLAQVSAGPEVLLAPEPNFYVLGAKSYGRGSAFLLRLGIEQIAEVASRWG